ncbi:MAG: hypothetical protein WBB01_06210 [Phormidesmis sp.]
MDLPTFLQSELLRLDQLNHDIRASGTVAAAGWAIDTSGRYARARPPRVKGKAIGKTIALGKVDGDEHRDWQQRIQRRNALQEIDRRAIALQNMIDNPIGWPETFEAKSGDPIAPQAD